MSAPTVTADGPAATSGGGTAAPGVPRRGRLRGELLLGALGVALLVVVVVAVGAGQVQVPPAEVLGSVLHRLGLDVGPMPSHPQGENALWLVRFPRVLLAVVVGASLGCAGALMQGVFGNPLAEPGVIGVSSGAAVGACTVIVVGGTAFGPWAVAGGAFVAGLATTMIVYLMSSSAGGSTSVTLVLTGIAVNAFAGGVLALLTFVASPAAREQIVFWQLGSLNGSTWESLGAAAPIAVFGIGLALCLCGRLDLLTLGERAARHVGVEVHRLRRNVVILVALLVASGVAFTGIIAFVGLVVPHLIRLVAGPGHRLLLPGSVLGGAIMLVLADLLARTLVPQADLPLGMLTALVGGPFFLWLLRRRPAGRTRSWS